MKRATEVGKNAIAVDVLLLQKFGKSSTQKESRLLSMYGASRREYCGAVAMAFIRGRGVLFRGFGVQVVVACTNRKPNGLKCERKGIETRVTDL